MNNIFTILNPHDIIVFFIGFLIGYYIARWQYNIWYIQVLMKHKNFVSNGPLFISDIKVGEYDDIGSSKSNP